MPIPSRRDFLQQTILAGHLPFPPAALHPPGGAEPQHWLPFRHIHLDFHSSPAIPDIGADFRAQEFAATLKEAAVNSITVFAKCHHGMSYYPTKIGVRHPSLKLDLLGETIEACHKQGIRVPVYISTMFDQHVWVRHGDWRVIDGEGRLDAHRGKVTPFTPELGRVCVNTPYLDYLVAQGEEVLRSYPVDGMFWDNFGYRECCCPYCMQEREKKGIDSSVLDERQKHARAVMERVMMKLASVTRAIRPKASVYINGPASLRQEPAFLRSVLKCYSHLEIESLPGGPWGYTYFQLTSRYLRNFGLETMGMTGSFHRSWGDFGTARNQAALDYECFQMLAQAATCSIGDHLHPRGQLSREVYARIGKTFRSVAEKEPWCTGARAAVEIATLLTTGAQRAADSDLGAANLLAQLRHQFDIIDPLADFSPYKLLILPDAHRLDSALEQKLRSYLASGGKLLLSHESGLNPAGERFALPLDLDYEGPWKHEAQYIEPLEPLRKELPAMVQEAYETGSAVKARTGATLLARVWRGYFDKDYRHFQVEQTPYSASTDYAAVAQCGNIVYIATPIFRSYARYAYAFYRQLVASAIERLLPNPLVRAEGPSTLQATVTEQGARRIVHLLHYIPERRAPNLDVVEDVIPLFDIKVALRSPQKPARVYLAPQRQNLRFEFDGGYARTAVPRVDGHQMVVFEL